MASSSGLDRTSRLYNTDKERLGFWNTLWRVSTEFWRLKNATEAHWKTGIVRHTQEFLTLQEICPLASFLWQGFRARAHSDLPLDEHFLAQTGDWSWGDHQRSVIRAQRVAAQRYPTLWRRLHRQAHQVQKWMACEGKELVRPLIVVPLHDAACENETESFKTALWSYLIRLCSLQDNKLLQYREKWAATYETQYSVWV